MKAYFCYVLDFVPTKPFVKTCTEIDLRRSRFPLVQPNKVFEIEFSRVIISGRVVDNDRIILNTCCILLPRVTGERFRELTSSSISDHVERIAAFRAEEAPNERKILCISSPLDIKKHFGEMVSKVVNRTGNQTTSCGKLIRK